MEGNCFEMILYDFEMKPFLNEGLIGLYEECLKREIFEMKWVNDY